MLNITQLADFNIIHRDPIASLATQVITEALENVHIFLSTGAEHLEDLKVIESRRKELLDLLRWSEEQEAIGSKRNVHVGCITTCLPKNRQTKTDSGRFSRCQKPSQTRKS